MIHMPDLKYATHRQKNKVLSRLTNETAKSLLYHLPVVRVPFCAGCRTRGLLVPVPFPCTVTPAPPCTR